MADHNNIVPFFIKWEGGLSRDTSDSASSYTCSKVYNGKSGWHTNKGVTYRAWVAYFGEDNDDRFFQMSDNDWGLIFKKGYWDKVKGDKINSQAIANVLVAWAWGSGSVTAVKQIQSVVAVKVDGIIGNQTLGAINSQDEKVLFAKCIEKRKAFYHAICVTNPKNKRFLKGWLNRLADFEKKFKP